MAGRSPTRCRRPSSKFGGKTELGRRRTELADAPAEIEHAVEDFVEREPITVVCSDKGWIRAAKGHLDDKAAGRAQVQGRRRSALRRACPVDRQDPGVRHQRPLLHAGLRQAAERARPWRADPADDRARQRAGHRAARSAEGRPQVPGGLRRRPRLRRAGRRGRGADQERQAGAQSRRQGEGRRPSPSCRRTPTRSPRSATAASS